VLVNTQAVPVYVSIAPKLVLNLIIPAAGLPGLCAVVPRGITIDEVAAIVTTPVRVLVPATLNAPVLVSLGVVMPAVPSKIMLILFPYTVGGTSSTVAHTHSSVGVVAQTKLPATGVTAILRTSLRYAMNEF
jgi:hypothetical protein